MIQNERQYKVTKTQIEKFSEALAVLETEQKEVEPWLIQLQRDAMTSSLEELQEEVRNYERLQTGKIKSVNVISLEDLPKALVQSRIAQGLTQKELAERLGVREQQVQHDESILYSSASLSRLQRIAAVLGVTLEGKAKLLAKR